jgi:pimeloyl-ACP methyl ester carboxylesterase
MNCGVTMSVVLLSPSGIGKERISFLFKEHFRPRIGKKPMFDDAALRRLTMPVLIVGGRDAMLDSHETKRRLEHAVPHASVCLLPDTGHFILDRTARILEFLCHPNTARSSR